MKFRRCGRSILWKCWPVGSGEAGRTPNAIKPTDFESVPCSNSGTPPFVSPLFIQPITGSEYEDYTSFCLFGREVGLHKFYLISPYIGHKPLLSRVYIIVSTVKHFLEILILHWNRLLSIKLISLHAFGLQAFRPTTHILLHMFLLGLPLVNTVWPSHFLGCFYGY